MRYLLTFLILFAHWVIWSGMLDAFHLSLGVVSCVIVTVISNDFLFKRTTFKAGHVTEAFRLLFYLPWLFYQIVLSNIHVAKIVLNPDLPIDPDFVWYKSKLTKDISLTTFSNSITLTPGTITTDVVDGQYYVHCLDKKVADDLLTGDMEKKVAHVFMED
jgi:multicomponent Na+:H+ antiporter subunit E